MSHANPIPSYLRQAYLLGLMMMAAGLTLSPFLMGLSQFWLALVWIVDGVVNKDFKEKWSRFIHNKVAVLLVLFFLMHLVGLLYTRDFPYAIRDLRVKLSFLILPFVLSSMTPLDRKRFNLVMLIYVLSTFAATQFSFISYLKHDYEDVREISRFISHIRFCLNIVFSMAIIGYYLFKNRISKGKGVPSFSWKIAVDHFLMWFLLFWFANQIFIFESLSGYVILIAVFVASLLFAFFRWKTNAAWRWGIIGGGMLVLIVALIGLYRMARPMMETEQVDFAALEKKTALGNDYWHDTVCNPIEDGKYVGLYYCRKELQEAWPQRSALPFDGNALNGENLEATAARYLTSKGLRKDAEGIKALSDEDIRNIEQGVANYNNWLHPGLRARLSSTIFEYNLYRRFNNPNGGSLSQRIEFTRASFHIIGQHPWFGVGTGDVPHAFNQAYDEIGSPLKEAFRFHAHNQYLSIAVAFGLVGLAFFLFVLLWPYLSSKKNRSYLYTVFLCIMLLSMFPEDTLETQAGASMFAFFEALLLFVRPRS